MEDLIKSTDTAISLEDLGMIKTAADSDAVDELDAGDCGCVCDVDRGGAGEIGYASAVVDCGCCAGSGDGKEIMPLHRHILHDHIAAAEGCDEVVIRRLIHRGIAGIGDVDCAVGGVQSADWHCSPADSDPLSDCRRY